MTTRHLTTANGEKLAHFNRERIPERVVHAKGSDAYGELTVTHDITRYTRARGCSRRWGKKTPLFLASPPWAASWARRLDVAAPPFASVGPVSRYDHRSDDDYYSQAGALYRWMTESQKMLLTDNSVGAMRTVSVFIRKRRIEHFKKADADYGARIEHRLATAANASTGAVAAERIASGKGGVAGRPPLHPADTSSYLGDHASEHRHRRQAPRADRVGPLEGACR